MTYPVRSPSIFELVCRSQEPLNIPCLAVEVRQDRGRDSAERFERDPATRHTSSGDRSTVTFQLSQESLTITFEVLEAARGNRLEDLEGSRVA